MSNITTKEHPDFATFAERLGGPGYCNLKADGTWECGDQSKAARLLKEMGFKQRDIDASL
jgi:hypothetical protein